MSRSVWSRLRQSLAAAEQWYKRTPERALNEAYEAAQAITYLENQYANGQTINPEAQGEGAVSTYFQTQLRKHLKTIRMRLTEYRFCSPILETNPQASSAPTIQRIALPDIEDNDFTTQYTLSSDQYVTLRDSTADRSQTILEKLQFIDAVLTRYEPWRSPPSNAANKSALNVSGNPDPKQPPFSSRSVQASVFPTDVSANNRKMGNVEGNSFIPRSILKTAGRFRRDLDSDPQTEEEVVQDFRSSRARTRSATRFLLLLVIIPLLTQQISKAMLVGPIVDRIRGGGQIEAWINPNVEEKFLNELGSFEEKLRFQNLVTETVRSPQETELALKEKAQELKQAFQFELREPIKNIFADILSLGMFALLIFTGRAEIATLRSFLDEIVYGLSDSAKAFILILLTDVFVGFHSPHGWEVVMESVFEHFGLPINRSFINMFIATFPVMLDTVFKYWIFRYLNQISPSAVATYKNMNE
jgi:CemA family